MKKHLPLLTLLSFSLLSSSMLLGQKDRFAYAITDVNQAGANWSFLRKLDLQNGSFSDVLIKGNDPTALAFDASTKKQMAEVMVDDRYGPIANAAFGTGVAAIAFDRKTNRLYYTPMFVDQLRYIDLRTMKVYFVNDVNFTGMKVKASDQSNIITRMAMGDDGNGYALTNDGQHLIRFSTGKKVVVTDLGGLIDDPKNGAVSIHNSCSSYGGDMIADDDGNLYVFSARNHVFRINIASRMATHLGAVSGLPASFTINGAAVDENNQVLVSSAIDNSSLFTVDTETWTATPAKAGPWKVADLANSNLLAKRPGANPPALLSTTAVTNGKVQLFPNPVTGKQFNVKYSLPEGRYTLQVTDVMGRKVIESIMYVKGEGQTERVRMNAATKAGVYQVRIMDKEKLEVYTEKILIQ